MFKINSSFEIYTRALFSCLVSPLNRETLLAVLAHILRSDIHTSPQTRRTYTYKFFSLSPVFIGLALALKGSELSRMKGDTNPPMYIPFNIEDFACSMATSQKGVFQRFLKLYNDSLIFREYNFTFFHYLGFF